MIEALAGEIGVDIVRFVGEGEYSFGNKNREVREMLVGSADARRRTQQRGCR